MLRSADEIHISVPVDVSRVHADQGRKIDGNRHFLQGVDRCGS